MTATDSESWPPTDSQASSVKTERETAINDDEKRESESYSEKLAVTSFK